MGRQAKTIHLTKSLHALLLERFPAGQMFPRHHWDQIICRVYGQEGHEPGCTIAMARVVTATGEAHGLWRKHLRIGAKGGQGRDIELLAIPLPEVLPPLAVEAF